MAFLRDTALSAVSAVAAVGGRLLVTILLVRALPQDDYGQFVYLQWVIEIVSLMFAFGLTGVLTRFLPELSAQPGGVPRARARWLIRVCIASIAFSTAAFVVYVLLDPAFGRLNILVMAAWCLTSSALTFQSAALQGLFRYDAATAGNIVFAAVACLLLTVLGSHMTVTVAVSAIAFAYASGFLVSAAIWLFTKARTHEGTHAIARAMTTRALIIYAGSLWLTSLIGNLVWSRGEFMILRFQVGAADIALYAAALTLAGAITQAANLLTGAITPHMARHWTSDSQTEMRAVLNGVTQATMICTATLAIGLIALGDSLIGPLFGHVYAAAYPVLCILAVAAVSIAGGSCGVALQIATDGKFVLKSNIVGLIVLFAVSAALAPFFGIAGIAVGRAVSQASVGVMSFYSVRSIAYLRAASGRYLRAYGFALAGVAAFYGLVQFIGAWPLRLAAAAAFTAAIAFGISLLIGIPLRALRRLGALEHGQTP